MALILNEGRVEESVAWLLEGGEGQVKEGQNTGGNLKIDISEELAHIAGMEIRYNCPRSEVERTIVGCEGDLEKAAEVLRSRRQDFSPPKLEDNNMILGTMVARDAPVNRSRQLAIPAQAASRRTNPSQGKGINTSQASHHPRREDKDFNYVKGRSQITPLVVTVSEGMVKNIQSMRKVQAKGEWQRPPSPGEKKLPTPGSWLPSTSGPSVSYSVANTVQVVTSSKTSPGEIRQRTAGLESKTILGASREPAVVQCTPLTYTAQLPASSIGVSSVSTSPILSSGWNGRYLDSSALLKFQYSNAASTGAEHLEGASGGKVSVESATSGITEIQGQIHSYVSGPVDAASSGWSTGKIGYRALEAPLSSSTLLSSSTPTCSVPASLGLFTGWGPSWTGSSIDWSTGPMVNCDYSNIDWSVGASPTSPVSSSVGFSHNFTSMVKLRESVSSEGSLQHLSVASSPSSDNSGSYDVWLGSNLRGSSTGIGLQDKTVNESGSATSSFGHEWTSPFAGKDLFSLPRQLVPSPPL